MSDIWYFIMGLAVGLPIGMLMLAYLGEALAMLRPDDE